MLQCLPLMEEEEGTDSEEKEDGSIEDSKESITMAFVEREHWGSKGFPECPSARQEEEEEKRLGLQDGEWGSMVGKAGGT